MTTKYAVKLSGEDEELVEAVRADANVQNKEQFTKLALLMFAQIYMKKKDQMEEEEGETNNSKISSEDSQDSEKS
jgi:hypothetical protein